VISSGCDPAARASFAGYDGRRFNEDLWLADRDYFAVVLLARLSYF
jgi:hypothetical protein